MFSFFKKKNTNNIKDLAEVRDIIGDLTKTIEYFSDFVDLQTKITQEHHKTIKTILDTIDLHQKSININDDNIKLLTQAVSDYFKRIDTYEEGNVDGTLVIKKTNKSN